MPSHGGHLWSFLSQANNHVALGPVSICIIVRSREVSKPRDWYLKFRIALKFDRCLGISTAETLVKFQSDVSILEANLMTLRLYGTLGLKKSDI